MAVLAQKKGIDLGTRTGFELQFTSLPCNNNWSTNMGTTGSWGFKKPSGRRV